MFHSSLSLFHPHASYAEIVEIIMEWSGKSCTCFHHQQKKQRKVRERRRTGVGDATILHFVTIMKRFRLKDLDPSQESGDAGPKCKFIATLSISSEV